MAEQTAKVFLDALLSQHPARDIAGTNDIYAPLIGSWLIEVLDAENDGSKRVTDGEWHFARVLEGRGVQDVLIVPARGMRNARTPVRFNRYVSSLRVFDTKSGVWRIHGCNPSDGGIHMLDGKRSGADIVEHGGDGNGGALRWTLFDIKPESFMARAESGARANGDGAAEWKIVAEILARREDPTDRMLAEAAR